MEYVKNLLNEPREMAIIKLLKWIDLVDQKSVVEFYFKIFPVFFVYAEVNSICLAKVGEILTKLKEHALFAQYQRFFEEWDVRFLNLRSPTRRRKASSPRLERVKNCTQWILGYADLDFFVALYKWLKFHKLHKYTFFFANLTHNEFANLSEDTMDVLETKVGIFPITTGARGTIIRRMEEELNNRANKLTDLTKLSFDDDENIKKGLSYLKKVFHTPIRKQSKLLSTLLETVITLVIEAILSARGTRQMAHIDPAIKVLQSAYSCQFFVHHQRSKFNTLRTQLLNIQKELNEISERASPKLSPEDQLLVANLKRIEFELMRMMNE